MLDVEVIGGAIPRDRVEEAVAYAAASAGIEDGHVAIEFVDADRIAELNEVWRSKIGPTDVLSFPVDEDEVDPLGERELGDVFICPEYTSDLVEAVVALAVVEAGALWGGMASVEPAISFVNGEMPFAAAS